MKKNNDKIVDLRKTFFFKDFGPTKILAKFYLDCNNSLNCTYWRQIL